MIGDFKDAFIPRLNAAIARACAISVFTLNFGLTTPRARNT